MKIKLISPGSTMRPMDSAWKTHMAPPLSLLVLGALTPRKHEVRVEDENVETLNLGDRPDLVGITVKVDTANRSFDIAAAYRQRGVPVVMGGIHATACPDGCLPHADSVVIGEAEYLWPKVVEDAESHSLRRIYRNDGPVDIAHSPIPRWDLLDGKNYLFTNTLCAGRGCPWRCDFCYNSSENIDARYRMKPVSHILREIQSLGTDHVMFIDDNFIGNPAQARVLLRELVGMKLTWHTAVSADIGRYPDILDLMAESGCKSLFIGFESVRQEGLSGCNKKQNRVGTYDATIAAIHQRGILVNASLVFGFDSDDGEVFPRTLGWLMRNKVSTMTAHILTPYPGTRLYKKLEAEGRIIDRDLDHYNTSHVVFQPARMTPHELEMGYGEMYDRFYSFAGIVRRMPRGVAQATAYLEFNLFYRKFGKVTSRLGHLVGMRRLAETARFVAYGRRRRPAAGGLETLPLVMAAGPSAKCR